VHRAALHLHRIECNFARRLASTSAHCNDDAHVENRLIKLEARGQWTVAERDRYRSNESRRFSDSAMAISGANPGFRLFVLKHCIESSLILLQAGLDEVRRGRDQSRPGYEDQASENDAPGTLRRWLGHR
jgi:hypothetical protein